MFLNTKNSLPETKINNNFAFLFVTTGKKKTNDFFRKSLTTSNKYILQSNIDKRIFELNYDFTNSIIKFNQYKLVPYNNSLEGKTTDEKFESVINLKKVDTNFLRKHS